jgi:peptidoglycan/LPS O-acetylase OafA/YrhL
MGHASARLSAIAGDLSYALYAIQVPLTWLFTVIVVSRLNSEPLRIAAWLLFVPAVVGLAWLATDIIDRPARRWLSGFYKPMRPVAAAATA